MSSLTQASWDQARQLDAQDELGRFRGGFFQQPGVVYLEGNSLGLLSAQAEQAVLRVLDEWRTLGIAGWLDAKPPWFTLAEEIAARMAPLVGATPDEIGIGDTTTINLHKLLALLYQPTAARPQVLADELNFPSDVYAIYSHARLRGRDPERDVVLVRSRDGHSLAEDDIIAAMTSKVQLLVVPAVLYRSGQLLDIGWLAREAQARGVLLAVDCSHSVGVVPHEFDVWGVDCAFWSTYKSLNGGPGAVAGWYLNRRHFGRAPGLAGWFGGRKETQFDMALALDPAPDAACLQVGTPHVLSMAPLAATLQTIAEAGVERLRAKSLRLTAFITALAGACLARFGFTVVGRYPDNGRGGHIALAHPEALRISKALRAANVVVDYRPPNLVRLGPSPLYTSFTECCEAIARLQAIMTEGSYRRFSEQRDLVS